MMAGATDDFTSPEAIQQTIDGFSDGDEDDGLHNTFSALSKSVKRVSFNSTMKKHLSKLEKEVEQLERKIEEQKRRIKIKQEKLSKRTRGEVGIARTLEDVMTETVSLEKKIQLTNNMTEVQIGSYTCKTIKTEENVEHREYTMEGTCRDINFKVDFGVEEDMESENDQAKIVELNIFVPDNVFRELKNSLISVSEEKSLHGFFILLQSYSKWSQLREQTFNHFVGKYPDYVTLETADEVPCICIKNTALQNGPQLIIHWNFEIGPTHITKSCLNLEVQASKKLTDHDKGQVLAEAPERFQQMLEEYGIERSINMIIRLMMDV